MCSLMCGFSPPLRFTLGTEGCSSWALATVGRVTPHCDHIDDFSTYLFLRYVSRHPLSRRFGPLPRPGGTQRVGYPGRDRSLMPTTCVHQTLTGPHKWQVFRLWLCRI